MIFTSNNTSTAFETARRQAFGDLSNSRHFFSSSKNKNRKVTGAAAIEVEVNISNAAAGSSTTTDTHCVPRNFQKAPILSLETPTRYQHTGRADNIDIRDRDDPLSVAEYAQDMYAYFRKQEHCTSSRASYMLLQPQINEKMRAILVDWLVNVQVQFKLGPETLFLAVNIIDRYLEKAEVSRSRLQLVGATSLYIAAKYEEVYNCPCVRDVVIICDNLYPRQAVVQMETTILCALGFKISVPTALTFLVRYLKAGHADESIALHACYVLEGTLLNYSLLQYLPSQIAAASTLIARHATHRNPWSPTLLKYAEYYEEDVIPIANAILEAKACTFPEMTAVNKKYSAKKYKNVAKTEFASSIR